MAEYKVSEVSSLLAVSADTVRMWIYEGLLVARRESNRHIIDGVSVAELELRLADGQLSGSQEISLRNELPGIVTGLTIDGVMAQVELQCGRYRVVSLISAEAARELELEIGSPATAQIKATNVSVRKG